MLSRKEEQYLVIFSAGMYWYICYWVVAICGPITRSPWRQPDQDPWCEGMWEALKLPPGLPDPDVDLRYEAGGWCRGTWYQIHQMHTVDIRWQCNVPWYRRFNSWFWLGDNKSITNQEREDFPKQSKAWSILVVQTLLTRTIKNSLDPTLTWIYDTNYIWLEWCQSPLTSSKQLLQLSRGWGAGRNAEWAEWAEWDCTWRALDFRRTRQVCPEMPRSVCEMGDFFHFDPRDILPAYTIIYLPFYAF